VLPLLPEVDDLPRPVEEPVVLPEVLPVVVEPFLVEPVVPELVLPEVVLPVLPEVVLPVLPEVVLPVLPEVLPVEPIEEVVPVELLEAFEPEVASSCEDDMLDDDWFLSVAIKFVFDRFSNETTGIFRKCLCVYY
jgi:signal-induced proliferation-associated 1 like protein 3